MTSMVSIFRRNTQTVPKKPEDFSDYGTIIASENDPIKLKEYIGKLYKAVKDKTKSLRNAYAKLDHLNNEIIQEKTRCSDIEDENRSLRDQMQILAAQLAQREDEFKEWQERLVDHAQEEREILEDEHDEECARLDDRIFELEEALEMANEEISILTSRIREMSDATSHTTTRRSSMDSRFSDTSAVVSAVKQYEDDRQMLADQLLEVTQKKVNLQSELALLQDEQEDLKSQFLDMKRENERLRLENEQLRQQIGRRAFMKSLEDINLDD